MIVVDELTGHVPDRYVGVPTVGGISCTPVVAAGRWLGVIFADRDGEPLELDAEERRTMRALGRTAALATTVREAVSQHERDALLLERIELAREVHESVMQRLFGVSMVLGSGRELSADDAERSAAEIEAALGELRAALDRSLEPTSEPARTTLRAELERLGRQYKAVPISVRWEPGADVPEGLEPLAVSVLGEALRNAEKHARPTEVRIAITNLDGAFALEVRNDGLGDVGRGRGSGLGLRLAAYESMQRGGMLEFGPEGGTSGGCGWCCRRATSRASSRGCRAMAESPLRVLIVDDHAVVQWGFKVLLGRQRWVERCMVASDPEEGLDARRAPQARTSPWSTCSSASAPAPSSARRSGRARRRPGCC